MKDTLTLEHAHIRDLLNQDKSNLDTINNFYERALEIINNHLNQFYNQYAKDNGLNISQVEAQSNLWDMKQYEQAINQIMAMPIANQQLNSRLQEANAKATQSKENTMGAMLSAGLAVGTAMVQHYGNIELPKQYLREYNFRSPHNIVLGNITGDIKKNPDFNHRIWSHNDEMVRRAQEQLHKSLQRGLNGNSIRRLTNTVSESDKRLSDNISSQANTMVSRVQLVFKVHSIRSTEQGKNDAYNNNDTDNNFGKWITQQDSRVCALCESMDGNIYPESDHPIPQVNTHDGCRCQFAECDINGNLSDVYP